MHAVLPVQQFRLHAAVAHQTLEQAHAQPVAVTRARAIGLLFAHHCGRKLTVVANEYELLASKAERHGRGQFGGLRRFVDKDTCETMLLEHRRSCAKTRRDDDIRVSDEPCCLGLDRRLSWRPFLLSLTP